MKYITYNREERNLCSHLFRLLHLDNSNYQILRQFLYPKSFTGFEIFTEVALIRDFYHNLELPEKKVFIEDIVKIIIEQEYATDCRLYSELESELNDPEKTHPKQIRQKALKNKFGFTDDENNVYWRLQAYFNAKPDLAILIDDEILVFEAKLYADFDPSHLERTKKIAEIWSKLLYKDLGFHSIPNHTVTKLGLLKNNPDLSWEKIRDIVAEILPANDKSLITFNAILENIKA